MNTKLKYTLGGLVAALLLAFNLNAAAEKPNVIVILVDDMGMMDSSTYGSTFYQTPNMSRLAKEGMLGPSGISGVFFMPFPDRGPGRLSERTDRA